MKHEENWKIEVKIVTLYPQKNAKKGEMFKCTNTSPSASLRLTPCQFLKVFTYMEVFYGTLIAQKGTIFVNFWRHFVFF